MRKLTISLLALALAAGVSCASAQASSIFFLRESNIWVANSDGSGATRVTSDGSASDPYNFVSSAKDGAAPPLAFERGDNENTQYGTLSPGGGGETVNPYSSQMTATITIRLSRCGHRGARTSKAGCRSVGTLRFRGKAGLNKLRVSKLHGHRLAVGRYQAEIATGAAQHEIGFTVRR